MIAHLFRIIFCRIDDFRRERRITRFRARMEAAFASGKPEKARNFSAYMKNEISARSPAQGRRISKRVQRNGKVV